MVKDAATGRVRHLLVVDDDDRIRELLKAFLTRAGFRVSAAPGGEAARRLLEALDFDLAILDVMMPGEDGLSLAAWIRSRPGPAGRLPVLMLTARGDPSDRIEGLRRGCRRLPGQTLRARGTGTADRGHPAAHRRGTVRRGQRPQSGAL
jgi:two-component system, OmpR family, phosphate regulon response regulator OmpR